MANNILSLDVGERRVGVAIANVIARFAHPLTTLDHTERIYQDIADLVTKEDVELLVIGLPRNLSGDDTAQTEYVRAFAAKIENVEIAFQDEALTSAKAEQELKARGKPFAKGDIDALAATYILEDYLTMHKV